MKLLIQLELSKFKIRFIFYAYNNRYVLIYYNFTLRN